MSSFIHIWKIETFTVSFFSWISFFYQHSLLPFLTTMAQVLSRHESNVVGDSSAIAPRHEASWIREKMLQVHLTSTTRMTVPIFPCSCICLLLLWPRSTQRCVRSLWPASPAFLFALPWSRCGGQQRWIKEWQGRTARRRLEERASSPWRGPARWEACGTPPLDRSRQRRLQKELPVTVRDLRSMSTIHRRLFCERRLQQCPHLDQTGYQVLD